MSFEQKKNIEQQDNSNNDNDFKELDNEIVKVIRGETSFDEEKTEKNNNDENTSNHFHNSKEIINNKNESSKLTNQNNNNNINNIRENININFNEKEKSKKIKNINQLPNYYLIDLNKNSNNINSPFIYKGKEQFNNNSCFNESLNSKFSNNNKNINNFQRINNEQYIVSNNYGQNNEYHNFNNLVNYPNQNNIDFNSPNNNYNQFNFYNNNECINPNNNNNNNLELFNICNKNNLFNNEFLEKKNGVNYNEKFRPYISLNNNIIMERYNFLSQKQIQEKHLINILNEINNNNINNFINVNNMIPNNYNQYFSINEMKNNIFLNQINNSNINNFNNFNNYNLNNNNNNNYYFYNNNGGNDNLNSYNNNIDINLQNNQNKEKDEMVSNKITNKRDYQKKKYKKSIDLFSNNNSNINSSKKYHSNKNLNRFNPEKNTHPNKRKIFNPIPDSEKEKNIINLLDILQCKDLRTTLMIKNIPNKYTIVSFLEEINEYFKDTYDIFYLPIDYINKCNLGFAFINFVEPLHIILFYELYRGRKWKKFNSEKICELLYAKFQGKKELISHFEKGKVLSFDNEDKRPLILNTPDPLPIINLPFYYLNIFKRLYPKIPYEIKEFNNNKNDNYSLKQIFSINGNFKNN